MAQWYRIQVPNNPHSQAEGERTVKTAYVHANHIGGVFSRLNRLVPGGSMVKPEDVEELSDEQGRRVEIIAYQHNQALTRKRIRNSYLIWDSRFGNPI